MMFSKDDFFIFFRSILKKWMKIVEKELFLFDIGHAEARLLMNLYSMDGCSQDELASKVEVDRSNVGRALKKLEKIGYIEREKSKEDGRSYRVFVTKKSLKIKEEMFEVKENLKKTVTMDMTDKEVDMFSKLLEKVDSSLCEENFLFIKSQDKKF